MSELPIVTKLLDTVRDYTRISPALINPDGPEAARIIGALDEALKKIDGLAGEINTSNYDHDDVCYLNAQFIEAGMIARAARDLARGADAQ